MTSVQITDHGGQTNQQRQNRRSYSHQRHPRGIQRTDEGTYCSILAFDPVSAEQDGLLVRAVFHNAHGKATTDAVALTVK